MSLGESYIEGKATSRVNFPYRLSICLGLFVSLLTLLTIDLQGSTITLLHYGNGIALHDSVTE